MRRKQFLGLCAAVGGAILAPAYAQQRYPQKVVRIVVPYVAGGNLDVTARLFAQHLTEDLGQPFVIENRPGANGNTGTEQIVRSAADGYSLAMVSAGTLGINPALYANMPFDPEKDLTHISIVATGPMVLQVTPSLPVRTMQELVDLARAQPGKLNFGSGGNGTLAHLSLEMLKLRAGVDIVHVAYKGTSLATTDVMAGHIQGMFDTLSTAAPLIQQGKVRALAVTSARRSAAFPNVPTVAEAGVRDYAAETWAGLVGPPGLPRDVVERLQAAVARIAARPDVQQRLAGVGSEAVGGTPEQFRLQLASERVRWAEVVKVSGAKAE
ncbi:MULTISPECIES: tripartite tricarboxylate transporter substrate-binding protein [Ramlibacter]|uniref:tripartite tricarboxylate transporter substrate-binding protein n=1 Tax=Ramlibacter TaxID=174951 RepID=UPI0012FADD79|nr:tripartite tricarboxylate transporter substrate binding protein [Ramlibacter sp. CGMCC 1.13660]